MADSPQTSEELPIAGKWWRDELKGCESTQVLEPSRPFKARFKYQQEMIIAALHFFESSTNTFQFECGMMTPTLFDVAAITGLPLTGDTYDPTLAGSKIEPKIQMDLFLPDLHNEEVGKRQIEGVRLARLIPRTRGLTYQQLFLQYFEAFLGLKEFKERFAPFADRQIEPSWFIHPFPPLPESEEYQNTVWSAFLTPTVISCRFGLKSTEFGLVGYFPNFVSRQFGLTQLLPKTIYLHERDICLGYYGMTEPQFYALLKKFEGLEYELTPFHFELSHAHTVDFARWWNLHYESQMVDVVVLRSTIEAGFNAQAIRKIKSTLNARGSRSKAESNSLAKPPFPPVKTEPGATTRKRAATTEAGGPSKKSRPEEIVVIDDDIVATTRKRAATTEAGGPSKKSRPEEIVVIDDDIVVEVEEKHSTPAPKASTENPHPESELRREEQTEKKRRKKKKKDKKSHSQSDPSVTNTSKLNLDVNEESKHQKISVDPDSTPKKTSTSYDPKNTDLGQGGPSSTVLVPEISPNSIVKTIVDELKHQLEHTREGELSPMTKAVEDTGVATRNAVSNLNETSPPKASAEVELTIEAESSKAGEIQGLDTSPRETLPTISEQTTPKHSNEFNPEVPSKDDNLDGDTTHAQVNPHVEETITAQTNPNPPLAKGPMMEFSQPSREDNAEVTKATENIEEEMSDKGEHSSTKDHHPSKSGNEDEGYEATDDFLNSSAGYARTAKTGDLIEDDGTSVSKPTSDFFLPSHVLQSVKDLAPEEALDTLLKTYGSEVPISEEDKQKLEDERKGDMLSYIDQQSAVYFNLKSLFTTLQRLPISEALSFQITQAENLLEQYARSLQHFNRLTIDLNKQIETRAKHFNLASQWNAEVNALKATSASAFLQIFACEDNIARWKSEIRELECKIGQEEEKKKQLEAQAVEVPKATIEEKAKTGIHHYSEALRAGVEKELGAEKNVVQ
ncbi:hypothetical protein TSUD_29150 [Trifolium subterraneum]|uniref:Uncharacterized protein n=1 Tax=Trifolium subterraneum TaxID=3900 RepID=A0A2Z6NSM0_TRISU|nr:hypothetical protein TSUD_29150 [Trifolium subterraneum]